MKKSLIITIFMFTLCFFPGLGNANLMEMTSPLNIDYVEWVDFLPMEYTGFGDVTGYIEDAGMGRIADFSSFDAGNIALIERGYIMFRDKALNAFNAGAIGAIIYSNDSYPDLLFGNLLEPQPLPYFPTVSTTRDVGLGLSDLESVVVHLAVDTDPILERNQAVPEPSTMLMMVLGFAGLIGIRARKKS